MTNYLIAGFEGESNSSKILLDLLSKKLNSTLYLKNDFGESEKQIQNYIIDNPGLKYIIEFGQKPKTKNISIETKGKRDDKELKTSFDYLKLAIYLEKAGFRVFSSDYAGKYLCNNIYYFTLDYIEKLELDTKVIFIHIPTIKNIEDINLLSETLLNYIINEIEKD